MNASALYWSEVSSIKRKCKLVKNKYKQYKNSHNPLNNSNNINDKTNNTNLFIASFSVRFWLIFLLKRKYFASTFILVQISNVNYFFSNAVFTVRPLAFLMSVTLFRVSRVCPFELFRGGIVGERVYVRYSSLAHLRGRANSNIFCVYKMFILKIIIVLNCV